MYPLVPTTINSQTDYSDFALSLKRKHSLMDTPIAVKTRKLKALSRKVNLWDAEAVRNYVQDAGYPLFFAYCRTSRCDDVAHGGVSDVV